MAAAGQTLELEWAEEVYSVKEAINKLGLPCMVKVVVGCDDGAFSEGTFLKLDFGINIRKIGASFVFSVEEKPGSSSDKTKDEILVPKGYKGKVRVVRKDAGSKIFTEIQELIKEFPRFVQSEEKLNASEEGSNKQVTVTPGSKIELQKVVAKQLFCKYKDSVIVLKPDDKIKCRLLEDDTLYTLHEVIDRLPIPQVIKFQDKEFQNVAKSDLAREKRKTKEVSDTLELCRITNQEVVVGILKPGSSQAGGTLKKVKQTLAIFSRVSSVINDIKVSIPKSKTDKMYQTTMLRMFPQEVDRSLISESLFVDLASNVNVHLLKENGWQTVKPKQLPKPVKVVEKTKETPIISNAKKEEKSSSVKVFTFDSKETPVPKLSKELKLPKEDKLENKPTSPKDKKTKKEQKDKKEPKSPKSKKEEEGKAPKLPSPRDKKGKSPSSASSSDSRNTPSPLDVSSSSPTTTSPTKISTPPPHSPIPEKSPSPPPVPDFDEISLEEESSGKLSKPKDVTPKKWNNGRPLPQPEAFVPSDYETPITSPTGAPPKVPARDNARKATETGVQNYESLDKEAYSPAGTYMDITTGEDIYDHIGVPTRESKSKQSKGGTEGRRSILSSIFNKKEKKEKKDKLPKGKKGSFSLVDSEKEPEKTLESVSPTTENPKDFKTTKPVGTVKPNTSSSTEKAQKKEKTKHQSVEFETLTVSQLCERLKVMKLDRFAQLCEENVLDGKFVAKLTNEQLAEDPFKLNSLEVMKLVQLKETGWIPSH